MKIEQVEKLSPIERLLYWIRERESIRLKRLANEPKPWTDDEILQSYRFCNVRRMDDKVSQWLLKNWYEPNYNHPHTLIACALARFINKPESLEYVGFPSVWNPKRVKAMLNQMKAEGVTIFNGAYMVRSDSNIDKIEYVVDRCVNPIVPLAASINPFTMSMKSVWELINQQYGFGSFMAGQVVADLRWAVDNNWRDRYTWAPMGPGSKRGMLRMHGHSIKGQISQKEFEKGLLELITTCRKSLPLSITNRLEMIDYQNTLCEYDKYSRVLFEEGTPKQRYNGAKE